MPDDTCRTADDKCEVSQGRIVGHDSNRVIDDSTNDKIGILFHEGTGAADRPCQVACDRHSLPCSLKTPQKAPTKPIRNQRKACCRWQLGHQRPSRRVANEADPRQVVRFPTTLATSRSTRLRRQARATGELGAANVVLSFEQFLRMGDLVRGWYGPSLGLAVLFAPCYDCLS
jgi:hypothetical protein